jgi:hypothetical protein
MKNENSQVPTRKPFDPSKLQRCRGVWAAPCAALLLALIVALVAAGGCGPAGGTQTKITNRTADTSSLWSEDLFSFALENLNHLEDNDCEEMERATQQRLLALKQPKAALGMSAPNA